MITMHKFRRDVDHKLRVLQHADQIGDVGKACRYFGVGRASFYRWRTAYRQHGLAGLENRKTAPKNPANRTAPEIVEKVLYLWEACRFQRVEQAGCRSGSQHWSCQRSLNEAARTRWITTRARVWWRHRLATIAAS